MEEASTRLVLAVGGLAGEWVRPPPPCLPARGHHLTYPA